MRPQLPKPGTVRRIPSTYILNGQKWELTLAGWRAVS